MHDATSAPARTLRVVMLLENNPYPLDVRVRCEAETLAQAGHQVTVICPREQGQPWREAINGVSVVRFPCPPAGRGVWSYFVEFGYATLACAALVMWRWAAAGIDVIHVHNPPDTLFIAGLLPRLAGKVLIYDHHDLSPELYRSKFDGDGGLLWRALLRLERWSCRAAHYVVTVNESYRASDVQRNGVPPERVWVVRNGPEPGRVQARPPDLALRGRAGTIIGYVGRIARQDGIDHLLRALHHLKADLGYTDWYCVIIGKADHAEALAHMADSLGIAERVWITGFVPDEQMLTLLSTADMCVAPDPSNPLNDKSTMNKVMEYMALGKPIIAYDLPEHRVSAGEAALYARPNDPLDMARHIARLIDTPALRAHMGAIGRQRIAERLSWDHAAVSLVRLYERVAEVARAARQKGQAF
jgi:glycosyltransferase involved in cell wall biosynthesis